MAYKAASRPQMAAPNVIPMADIMLVLLISLWWYPHVAEDPPGRLGFGQECPGYEGRRQDDAIVVAVTRDGQPVHGQHEDHQRRNHRQIKDRIANKLDKTVYVKSDAARQVRRCGRDRGRNSGPRALTSSVC